MAVLCSHRRVSRDHSCRYMCRGVENLPITMAGLTLPTTTRLELVHTRQTVTAGSLVNWANISGKSGLLRQLNLVINSTDYAYQEGCVSAKIDGSTDLWLSSGLEDYFLGACRHSLRSGNAVSLTADLMLPPAQTSTQCPPNIYRSPGSKSSSPPRLSLRRSTSTRWRPTEFTSQTLCFSQTPSSSSGLPPPTTRTRTRVIATMTIL